MNNKYQSFFEQYALSINNQALEALPSFFNLPFILVHQEPKSVVAFDAELELKVSFLLAEMEQQGISSLTAKVKSSLVLSPNMTFITVEWQGQSHGGEVKYTNSYIVSDIAGEAKIVTIIVDDSHDLFSQLLR